MSFLFFQNIACIQIFLYKLNFDLTFEISYHCKNKHKAHIKFYNNQKYEKN